MSSLLNAGGSWSAPQHLQPSAHGQSPPILGASRHKTVAIWDTQGKVTQTWVSLLQHGAWLRPHPLTRHPAHADSRGIGILAYPNGAVRAVWTFQKPYDGQGLDYQLRTAVRGARGRWSATSSVARSGVDDTSGSAARLPGRSAAFVWAEGRHMHEPALFSQRKSP